MKTPFLFFIIFFATLTLNNLEAQEIVWEHIIGGIWQDELRVASLYRVH